MPHPLPSSATHTWASSHLQVATEVVHAGVSPEPHTGAILTPIFQSSVFVQESIETYLAKGHSYSGSRNPTVAVLEEKIATLEKAQVAYCFGSGMAAIVTTMATFLRHGDHCILSNGCYATTQEVARDLFGQLGVTFSFVDFSSLVEIEAAIQPNTKILFSEYPTNPTLTLTDLAAVSALAHQIGAKHVCDSTLASPMVICPLNFGADIVIQSTTKYYDGHNMTIGGAVACASEENGPQIFAYRNRHGSIMSPMVAFLTLQSTKTMHLRIREQSNNATQIATFLTDHPKIDKVGYPGLADFPQKALADRQHSNGLHGGMLYFILKGGAEASSKFMQALCRPWSFGANLGGVESLISYPPVMSNGAMDATQLQAIGISEGFVRVSCGIEDAQDLVDALEATLRAC
ncbi:MAG: PLP-dependent aspartate aminotransferase family protein [Candidatus Cardinium sp.]|uniref:trans-sulfuration enzyme family protein n=1 Tax=Candidatus Cardinium sp. TP TaxID=2961955 RepID=UPI0021AF18BC|nr:PLP-dependent aspartate aminotransferase family protein [Candidatus Cardinium sp. TP]MCT4696861.1 PLP-dependent aspartate aminotransferase family protein [Candidatus Cardinium sp. TP]MDN5246686.1 PLP-dependent aspartate aminotransferase family protein [Candidatus Cardinium sp.]